MGMKKACDIPYLVQNSACVMSQGGWHGDCAAPAYIGAVWLVETAIVIVFVQVFSCFSLTHEAKCCFSQV